MSIKAISFLLLLVLSFSCTPISPQRTELLFRVELRDIELDRISEYRIFTNGLINKTILNATNNPDELFGSEFSYLRPETLKSLKDYLNQLRELDYHNDFPWKEDFYQRGNVIKFEFLDYYDIAYLPQAKSREPKQILLPRVFYYYSGHQDSPKIFTEIVKILTDTTAKSSAHHQ
jgi:hypothetical protein